MLRKLIFFIPAFLSFFITSSAIAEEWYEQLESSTIVYAPNVNRNITQTTLAEKRSGSLDSLKAELRADIQRAQIVGLQGPAATISATGWDSFQKSHVLGAADVILDSNKAGPTVPVAGVAWLVSPAIEDPLPENRGQRSGRGDTP